MTTVSHKRMETRMVTERVIGLNPKTKWKNVKCKKFKIQGGPMVRSSNQKSILRVHTTQTSLQIKHRLSRLMQCRQELLKEDQNMSEVQIVSKTRPTY